MTRAVVAPSWRAAALIAGVPAAALLAYGLLFMVVGFPVSLIVLPFAAPVIFFTSVQVKAAMKTWQGFVRGAVRLRNLCFLLASVLAVLVGIAALSGDDGVQRSSELLQERARERLIVMAVIGVNALALALLVPTTPRPRLSPTTAIARAAAGVLGLGVLAVLFWPRSFHG